MFRDDFNGTFISTIGCDLFMTLEEIAARENDKFVFDIQTTDGSYGILNADIFGQLGTDHLILQVLKDEGFIGVSRCKYLRRIK